MSVTQRLVFDTTDAASIAASSNVGAYVRSSSGNLITSGDGSADDLATSFEGLDARAFAYGFDGTNWDRLRATNGALHVDIQDAEISIAGDYPEDSPHVSGDIGLFGLGVRRDTRSTMVSADGDYSGYQLTAEGDLRVRDDDANTSLSAIDTSLNNIEADLDSLTKLEDSAHVSGDAGIMGLAVRNDAGTSLVSADGDYSPLSVNSSGALYVAVSSIQDAALANTAIENTATAVSTTAVNVVASALANRKYLFLANEGNRPLYWGKSSVTTANGFPLYPGMQHEARIGAAVAVQIIGAAGSSSEDLRVMELS